MKNTPKDETDICSKCHKKKNTSEFKVKSYKGKPWRGHVCLACYRAQMRVYYKKKPGVFTGWRKKNPERFLEIAKRYFLRLKQEVISAYGGKCACCGENGFEFLTIEHTRHDGKEHRNISGQRVYTDLRKRGYPKDIGIEIFCWNCNMATRYGEPCPHKLMEKKK